MGWACRANAGRQGDYQLAQTQRQVDEVGGARVRDMGRGAEMGEGDIEAPAKREQVACGVQQPIPFANACQVVGIMRNNMEKVLERDARLGDLEDKSGTWSMVKRAQHSWV